MKIGEKVRFLNEVGGGTISGFQGKDIVMVQDDDGFDIPMLRSQVVVIETNENNFERPQAPTSKPGSAPHSPKAPAAADKHPHTSPAKSAAEGERPYMDFADDEAEDERPVTFRPKPKERKNGEQLNIFLAFIPENARELTSTRFEAHVINDSNYFLSLIIASRKNASWQARWQATLEPNTKMLVESFERSQLNDMEYLCIQGFAWKQDKTYMLQPAVNVQLRIDLPKFYKLHVFQKSPFFREPALIYDIVRDGKPIHQVFVDAEEVLSAITQPKEETMPKETPKQSKPNAPRDKDVLEVDLHISALLDNTAGLSNSVLLNTQLTEFRTIMERNIKKKGQRIVFIHGKGEGVLRNAIIKELQHRYRNCTYQDASFREYGFGATLVTIG
ncbi:MAG: DUF2027 domain-containing protein [Bacteroidaceae bacterium]|nr:DUF2027 domain-containing protein [Bacteroidaceae bacterium]